MRKRLALCVGINDYPGSGSDLSGCVNDAVAWQNLLAGQGYEVIPMHDSQATKRNILLAIEDAMLNLKFADRFVFTYSGHGSWVPDRDGDEADARDEVLVAYDWQNSGFITDDELYRAYQMRLFGVRVMAISDSCHSGSVARGFGGSPVYKKARFFDPNLLNPGVTRLDLPRRRNIGSRPGTMLLSGCADNEVSYDAHINGRYQGAMTHATTSTWSPGISFYNWYTELRKFLPSAEYNQTPQLQATGWQRRWRF